MKTMMEITYDVLRKAQSKKYAITDIESGITYSYGNDNFMDRQLENCLFVDMQSQIAPDQTDYIFDRTRYKIETINSMRKNDVKSVHLEVNEVNAFHNEEYEGFTILWSSDIGFGEYQIYKRTDDVANSWHGDSEHMDLNDDKEFLEELMRIFIKKIQIE